MLLSTWYQHGWVLKSKFYYSSHSIKNCHWCIPPKNKTVVALSVEVLKPVYLEAAALDVWLSHKCTWIYCLPSEQPCGPFGHLNCNGTFIMCSACHECGWTAVCIWENWSAKLNLLKRSICRLKKINKQNKKIILKKPILVLMREREVMGSKSVLTPGWLIFSVVHSQCCSLLLSSLWKDHVKEKKIPLTLKTLWMFHLVDSLSLICKPELLFFFPPPFFPGLQDPFDSPKGKTCQKALITALMLWLQSCVSSSPFISAIHPSLLPGSSHSSAVSH